MKNAKRRTIGINRLEHKGYNTHPYANDIDSLKKVQRYLCAIAICPDSCAKCISQCAYGRRYLELIKMKGQRDKQQALIDKVCKINQLLDLLQVSLDAKLS